MWISAPWPGIKPSPPALESEGLTTGPPGKSPVWLTVGYQMMCVCVSCSVVSDSVISDSMDCSPPGSSLHGILQARILEWVAISFSRIANDISNELWNLYLESITSLKVSVNTDNFGLNLVGQFWKDTTYLKHLSSLSICIVLSTPFLEHTGEFVRIWPLHKPFPLDIVPSKCPRILFELASSVLCLCFYTKVNTDEF